MSRLKIAQVILKKINTYSKSSPSSHSSYHHYFLCGPLGINNLPSPILLLTQQCTYMVYCNFEDNVLPFMSNCKFCSFPLPPRPGIQRVCRKLESKALEIQQCQLLKTPELLFITLLLGKISKRY